MVMGRPTKPTALKQRLGTARPDRIKAPLAVLSAVDQPPPMPKGLGALGKKAWKQYWTLGSTWLSPRTDAQIITRLCRAYDEEVELRRDVEENGHTVLSERNGMVANPAVSMLRKLEELITRYEGLCGFTPSDRSRLGMAEVTRVSKLDQLIQNRQARRAAE